MADARSSTRGLVVAALLATALVLHGCGGAGWNQTSREEHVVRTGETLYTIAWRYGKDYRDLARWNRLGDGSLIYPGQVIRLTPPSGDATRATPSRTTASSSSATRRPAPKAPQEPPPAWAWPTRGRVVAGFGARAGSSSGMLIAGKLGQPVVSAADGRVVYSGSGLIGYGRLIIIKHNETYLSAYGHNASLLVKEGETVRRGQRIATMGEGPGQEPRLHFEIRRNGVPVDPGKQLPAR